jgi:hypothetical protein
MLEKRMEDVDDGSKLSRWMKGRVAIISRMDRALWM